MAPLYPVTGSAGVAAAPFTVNIPTAASGPHGPTGQVGRQRIDVANVEIATDRDPGPSTDEQATQPEMEVKHAETGP